MFIASLALSLVLFQDPPVTQATQQTAAEVAAAQEAAEEEARLNEIICRRERVVGSNRPERICQTRREWNRIRVRPRGEEDNGEGRDSVVIFPVAGAGR